MIQNAAGNRYVYAYEIGKAFRGIKNSFGNKITPTAEGNVARRPDLMRAYLRHLDLSEFVLPEPPEGWKANDETPTCFWLGFYAQPVGSVGKSSLSGVGF